MGFSYWVLYYVLPDGYCCLVGNFDHNSKVKWSKLAEVLEYLTDLPPTNDLVQYQGGSWRVEFVLNAA